MTEKHDNIYKSESDIAILKKIATFIKSVRLEQNKSQTELAKEAGISRSALSEFERSGRTTIITLIQLLRVLNKLHVLENFEIKQQLSPIKMAEMEQAKRKRAYRTKANNKKNESDW